MSEEEIIDKTIDILSRLDEYYETLEDNTVEKANIYTKAKELVFWLTYYKENKEDEWRIKDRLQKLLEE